MKTQLEATLMQSSKPVEGREFSITPQAIGRICALIEEEKKENPASEPKLRVSVLGGGCSGFQYVIEIDLAHHPEDIIFSQDNALVIIDEMSLDILKGSVIDYVEEMIGAAFVIKNPNAKASCGCGNSFSVV